MNVRDNLLLGAYGSYAGKMRALLGSVGHLLKSSSIQNRLERVFRLFPRLEERLGQDAGSLSGGEQQMLAIGRALMAAPEILLLDEPSIGLAPQLVQEIMRLLPRLQNEGLTILLVEQDIRAALSIADRGYVMETGNIVMEGSSAQLLDSPRVRRAYLGKV
jgi:branched-chain amino acid transport system ATP-binding protein